MSDQNKANTVNKLQKSQTRQMLDKIEDKQEQQKTLNKLDELLEINLKYQAQKSERTEKTQETEKRQEALKDLHNSQSRQGLKNKYASSVKFGNPTQELYANAVKETQKMIELSELTQNSKHSDAKKTSDLIQLNKKEPTKNIETKSFVENQSAISQQIAQDNKLNFKAIKIAEDVAVKGNMPDNQEKQAKSSLKKQEIDKSAKPNNKMEVFVNLGNTSDNNQESKGKAYIVEEIKEKLKDNHTAKIKKVITPKKQVIESNPKDKIEISEEAENIKKTAKNKLRAKFNKHK